MLASVYCLSGQVNVQYPHIHKRHQFCHSSNIYEGTIIKTYIIHVQVGVIIFRVNCIMIYYMFP